jgi:UDP-N-acetylglucosamine--N-acetylmuramyl-(pentapeptide) pyrophosphoryl-undecaprenol N-acetylglucosamine transferase
MKKIVLTGGGTAGHVTPNIALMPELKKRGYKYYYIGSYDGMEKEMIESLGVRYFGVATGKLRRYFSLENFTDPAKVIKGYFEARKWLKKIRPDVVFSKGGFVSVPVVLAAHRLGIPVVIHESDMTPGLANKISIPSADAVCCNFPETVKAFPDGKALLTGSPIRQELFAGSRESGLRFCGFSGSKPVILIIGGSQGSVAINNAVRRILPALLQDFNLIHLCGKGNLDEGLTGTEGYVQYEFISEELPDLMAAADLVISRAGANVICELLALRKPNILIPLPAIASRGDQVLNAQSFEKQGFSCLLPEADITDELLLKTIQEVFRNRQTYIDTMANSPQDQAIPLIADLLDRLSEKKRR